MKHKRALRYSKLIQKLSKRLWEELENQELKFPEDDAIDIYANIHTAITSLGSAIDRIKTLTKDEHD